MKRRSHFKRNAAIMAGTIIIAIGATVVTYLKWEPESDTFKVPLGVEQAAIITYSGPLLTVAPYKWGVAVNVRIAEVIEQPDRHVYDVRYIVNRAGTFDLRDYLVAADGSDLSGLPEFQFTGDAKLSKDLDTRIEETEKLRIEVGGRYYETMALLFVLWIGWLLLLIFYKRPRGVAEADTGPTGPTLAEQLQQFLAKLEAGTLNAAEKARMEMLLLRCWRDQLGIGDTSMSAALEAIGHDEETAEPLRKLQHWLHHPASTVPREEIAAVVAPFTADIVPSEETAP